VAKELVIADVFKENYRRLSPKLQERFDKKLEFFLQNPKHPSLNIHRYHSQEDMWEAYVTHTHRFTFSVTKDSIFFRNIGPHSMIDKGKV